jgi:LuxR family maltose regulon positive regulatory protein
LSQPVLAAKFFIPPLRPGVVHRPRLIERLDGGPGSNRSVSLISAPAGFGKTTLVTAWIQQWVPGREEDEKELSGSRQPAVAWLSLDEADNDPNRFVQYLVTALQTFAPTIGAGVLEALQSSQPPPLESLLPGLVNDIATLPHRCILVLDDYHVIKTDIVDQLLTFLIGHLSPLLHLVFITREDPPLPLSRLRARGQLTEIRAADLRFTTTEAATFFNQVMGLELTGPDIATLEQRTEGWIAGLQLAALALQGTADGDATNLFIREFSGTHRFVLDYLVDEVLRRQPEPVRQFLLNTSILNRLCAPLCDAVSGRSDSQTMLERLERDNLFIVPLDNRRGWYRYHHLFADVLRTHATAEPPGYPKQTTLHQRASIWFSNNERPAEAIHHALAAGDFEHAADLLELARPTMDDGYESASWLGWVRQVPDALIRLRPVLSVGYAWALLDVGEITTCELWLETAEQWLNRPDSGIVVVDKTQFQTLPASIAAARAYHALAMDDVAGTETHVRQVLRLLPEGDHKWRRAALALLGLIYWRNGNLEAAAQAFADFTHSNLAAGNIVDAISTTYVLADIMLDQGRLYEAENSYKHTLRFIPPPEAHPPVGSSDLYRGLSEIYLEWNNLEQAGHYLRIGARLGEHTALTDWPRRLAITQARLEQARGELTGALHLLNQADRLAIKTPLPDVHPVAALRARVWIAQGHLKLAQGWLREQGLSVDDDLSYLREYEYITLTRLLLARFRADHTPRTIEQADRLLGRLLSKAEAGQRQGSVIEILILQALARQAQGDTATAVVTLDCALALAEPEDYVRMFVDEGPPMATLLAEIKPQNESRQTYIQRLLSAFAPGTAGIPVPADIPQPLLEPLSDRELEVLQLLNSELSGPEIARELVVSLNTMRTHTKSIYSKLGVNNRRAAVRRAQELGLI